LTEASTPEKRTYPRGTAIVAGLIAGLVAGLVAYLFAGLVGFIIAFIIGAITGSRATLLVNRGSEQPS
jgi:ammonia channel protein AmtB